jgi:anti-anti-sigma factor
MVVESRSPTPAPSPLELDVTESSEGFRVRLSGELDLFSAEALRDTLLGLELNGGRSVVLEASNLTFCDAAGVSALLETHRRIAEAQGRLVIRGLSGLPLRVIELTRVVDVLHVESNN